MNIKTRIASILTAIALTGGVGVQQGTKPIEPEDVVELNEIVSQRTATSKIWDMGNGHRKRIITPEKKHWKNKQGEWKTIDLRVRRRALLNTLGKYKNVVAAGPYRALFDDDVVDYKFSSNEAYIEYEFLTDQTGITIDTESTVDGIKQNYILVDENAATELHWLIITNATLNDADANADLNYFHNGNNSFTITKPFGWDAADNMIDVHSHVSGDTLIYNAIIPENVTWPVTVDPTTVTAATLANTGRMMSEIGSATYLDTRSATTAFNTDNTVVVGQEVPANFRLYRASLEFDTSGLSLTNAIVDSAKIVGFISSDQATDDFDMVLVQGDWTGSIATSWWNDFSGWAAGDAAYSVTDMATRINSSVITGGGDTLRFNLTRDGINTINDAGDTKFMLMSENDIIPSAPVNSNRVVFTSASIYLEVFSFVTEPNTTYTKDILFTISQTQSGQASATYSDVRNTTDQSFISTNSTADSLGQNLSGSDKQVWRISLSDAELPEVNTVYSASIIYDISADNTTTDFDILTRLGEWTGGTTDDGKYFDFDGWVAASNPYPGFSLTNQKSTSEISTGVDSLIFNDHGKTKIVAASGDTLKVTIISSKDSSNVAPTDAEWLLFDNTVTPILRITFANNDSVPANFAIAQITGQTDSLVATWDERTVSAGVTYTLIDSVTSAQVPGTGSISSTTESIRVGGLLPNSYHAWKLEVTGGGVDGEFSNIGSAWTEAATPVATPVLVFNPNGLFVKMLAGAESTGTGNPLFTEYAWNESITDKYVDFTADPDTIDQTGATHWATIDSLKDAADSLTISLINYYGQTINLRVKARDGTP